MSSWQWRSKYTINTAHGWITALHILFHKNSYIKKDTACITMINTSSPVQMLGFFLLMGNLLLPLGSVVLKAFAVQYFPGVGGKVWLCILNLYNTGAKSWSYKRCKQGPLHLKHLSASSAEDSHAVSSEKFLIFPLFVRGLWHSEVSHRAPEMSCVSRSSAEILLRWIFFFLKANLPFSHFWTSGKYACLPKQPILWGWTPTRCPITIITPRTSRNVWGSCSKGGRRRLPELWIQQFITSPGRPVWRRWMWSTGHL